MTPYQRRALAAAIFAFTFILFYEARGERLISHEPIDVGTDFPVERDAGTAPPAAVANFRQQIEIGVFVLALGSVLLVVLRRKGQRLDIPVGEWVAYALGLGILIGTAVVSWYSLH
ncbi:MAG TPA: hypothetical protein VGP72_29550 [Planctomycetota bacterium]|jgi:hypothetical protein